MKELKKVLIVEDEALVADHLAVILEKLDYEIVGIADSGDEAISILEEKEVEIALLDINLIGGLDGVDVAHEINNKHSLPFVFLTSNTDSKTIERVRRTEPHGFIVKPFDEQDIKPILEIAAFNWQKQAEVSESADADVIYIKKDHELVKLDLETALYFEAYDNYTKIYTAEERFVIPHTLKKASADLPSYFYKTHRSFVVNCTKIESILPKSVIINGKEIPLSESGRKGLLEKIKSF